MQTALALRQEIWRKADPRPRPGLIGEAVVEPPSGHSFMAASTPWGPDRREQEANICWCSLTQVVGVGHDRCQLPIPAVPDSAGQMGFPAGPSARRWVVPDWERRALGVGGAQPDDEDGQHTRPLHGGDDPNAVINR